MIAWWCAPLSGALDHVLSTEIMWHGRLMVLAWAILLPLGTLAARYWKIWPGQSWPARVDHRGWWHSHRLLQTVGVGLTLLGVALLWRTLAAQTLVTNLRSLHAVLGYALVVIGVLQVLHGLLRGSKGGPTAPNLRGDHYNMSWRRRVFERVHKALGWFAIAASVLAILSGLWLADAPRWMVGFIVVWWTLLCAFAVWWQRQGRCIDTYQAIWGPGPEHPGNSETARAPIGWGIKRLHESAKRASK